MPKFRVHFADSAGALEAVDVTAPGRDDAISWAQAGRPGKAVQGVEKRVSGKWVEVRGLPSSSDRSGEENAKAASLDQGRVGPHLSDQGSSEVSGGKYDTARVLVQVVLIVGWVVVAIGGLILLSAITQEGIRAIVTAAAGAFVSLQGLVVVVVSYLMLATLDTAVNTGETVLLIRRLPSMLEKKESGQTSHAEDRQHR